MGFFALRWTNVWATPTCFIVATLTALFVALARRHGAFAPDPALQTAGERI
jgi:hypothetical protein